MKPLTYVEKRIGRSQRVFELTDQSLRVEVLPRYNTKPEEFDLTKVSPNFTQEKVMNVGALNRASIYLAIVWSIAVVVRAFAPSWTIWISVLALLISYPGIYVILYFIRPVKVVRFRDTRGEIAFEFMPKKENTGEIEKFIAALQCAIVSASPKSETPGDD